MLLGNREAPCMRIPERLIKGQDTDSEETSGNWKLAQMTSVSLRHHTYIQGHAKALLRITGHMALPVAAEGMLCENSE